MRKSIIITVSVILQITFFAIPCFAISNISADAAALAEVKSGQIIYAKNGNKRRAPASLTKMMTAILAVEYGDLRQKVSASSKAAYTLPSKMHLRKGEVVILNDLLKAALLKSANDSCVAMAEHVAGDEAYFVYLMNLKAWALCLSNTNFINTNGLPAKYHYSSAIDLAKIGVFVKRNLILKTYVAKKADVIIRNGKETRINNTNKLLWSFSGANGIKTGTTNAAGKCLASSANINNDEFVSITLHADDRYRDSTNLLRYAFEKFHTSKIAELNDKILIEKRKVSVYGTIKEDIYLPLKDKATIQKKVIPYIFNEDIDKGEKCGLLVFVTEDGVLWYDIYALQDIQVNTSYKGYLRKLFRLNEVSLYRYKSQ